MWAGVLGGWLVVAAQAGAAGDAPGTLCPVLAVEAPAEAARVVAYFPFGVTKELSRDARSGLWRGRALIGRGIPEGSYPVAMVVEARDGSRQVRRENVELRADSPAFEASLVEATLAAGGTAELVVDTVEPASSVVARAPSLGWTGVPLGPSTSGSRADWGVLRTVPLDAPAGEHALQVTVTDPSGRTFTRQLVLRVVRRAGR